MCANHDTIQNTERLMVRSHCLTSRQTQRPRQTPRPIHRHRSQWESVLVSVPLQSEHLHTILLKPCFISLSVGQCEHTMKEKEIFSKERASSV